MKRHAEYVYSGDDLTYHLGLVAGTVRMLIEEREYPEPAKITTDWRDDGNEPDEHNGWVSIIEWPEEVRL